jgi:hypothetical protein
LPGEYRFADSVIWQYLIQFSLCTIVGKICTSFAQVHLLDLPAGVRM